MMVAEHRREELVAAVVLKSLQFPRVGFIHYNNVIGLFELVVEVNLFEVLPHLVP